MHICSHTHTFPKCLSLFTHSFHPSPFFEKKEQWLIPSFLPFSETLLHQISPSRILTAPFPLIYPGFAQPRDLFLLLLAQTTFYLPSFLLLWISHHLPNPLQHGFHPHYQLHSLPSYEWPSSLQIQVPFSVIISLVKSSASLTVVYPIVLGGFLLLDCCNLHCWHCWGPHSDTQTGLLISLTYSFESYTMVSSSVAFLSLSCLGGFLHSHGLTHPFYSEYTQM